MLEKIDKVPKSTTLYYICTTYLAKEEDGVPCELFLLVKFLDRVPRNFFGEAEGRTSKNFLGFVYFRNLFSYVFSESPTFPGMYLLNYNHIFCIALQNRFC